MSAYLAWLLLTCVVGALLALAVHRAYAGRLHPSSPLGIGVLIATLVVLFAGCAYGARLEQTGAINCQVAEGDYIYGEFGWSTVPPGPTCTFNEAEHGVDEVRGPSPAMSVWLALVAVGAATTAVIALRERTTSGAVQAQRPA
jgi:hypothetical protein